MTEDDKIDQLAGRLLQVERKLSATRLVAQLAAIAALLGWLCFGAVLVYGKLAAPPHEFTVKDSLGNTAVLDGISLTFRSAKGSPVAWFTASPLPNLQMTVDGIPAVRLGILGAADPYGYLSVGSKAGTDRMVTPQLEPTPKP